MAGLLPSLAGSNRVPADDTSGKASLRFELPKESGYVSVPTDLPVALVVKESK